MNAQTNSLSSQGAPREWRRFHFPRDFVRWGALLGVLVFLAWTTEYLGIPLERFVTMWPKLFGVFAERYYPPDIDYVLDHDYLASVVDTIQMAYLGMLFGVLAAIPLAWFAAFNMSPNRFVIYPAGRFVLMCARAVHETIWTILFVTILGFGMLAGVLALTVFCIGFAGKLFAEEIEAIDPGPVEAMRATGANQVQVMLYGVWPQVRVAFTGIAIYTWDVAFRAATVVGFFGAGGMGWYLKRNVYQIESERVAAILLSIIVLVMLSEIISAGARARVAKAK